MEQIYFIYFIYLFSCIEDCIVIEKMFSFGKKIYAALNNEFSNKTFL